MDAKAAYALMHQGAVALAEVEANGMRIDVPYLDKAIKTTARRIAKLEDRLRGCEEYKLQRRRYGTNTNLTSRDQLAAVLFGDMGHTCHSRTATGKAKLDETALEGIGTKYATKFLLLEKLNKLHSTYLTGIRREVEGEFVHANFGLHLVRSYRGQSDNPNLQNQPIRDAVQGPILRKAFIPRDGCAIVEMDYSSLEVMVACALSGDPKLPYDAQEGDMHRDMAAECYLLDKDSVTKGTRQNTKGGFVFAQFYGDWFKACAHNLWDGIDRYNLTTPDGASLHTHLRKQGITGLGDMVAGDRPKPGTFEAHIEKVEKSFWNKRFKVYHAKRKRWVAEYERDGYIDLVTGFRCHGPMRKNQVMNYHIQGPAFHCLLWSLTRIMRETKRRKMGTKIISQIHDSIIADVPLAELDDYLEMAADIATTKLREHWPWITVRFEVEAEVATTNWYEKKEVELP